MMLYPVAPLHDGGVHSDSPTIEFCQPVTCQKISAPVKHRKHCHRPVENIIRAILLDSTRFYNPNRRRHRREHTSTGTKLIYLNVGRPRQRKRMRSFLWDSEWRHEPGSPDAESCVFETSSHSVLPPSLEEQIISKHYENSENSRFTPRSEVCLLNSIQSPLTLPIECDLTSFHSSQSSLQHSHCSTLPRFDEGENEPTKFTMESPKSLQIYQTNLSNPDNNTEYSQDSLDSKRLKWSRDQRDRQSSGSSSNSSDSSSPFVLTRQVRTSTVVCLNISVCHLVLCMIMLQANVTCFVIFWRPLCFVCAVNLVVFHFTGICTSVVLIVIL